jgi:protein SCO1
MMRTPRAVTAFALALLLVLAAACGPERFEAKGTIVEVRADLGQVMIDHEDIPGLMPAMTMSFDVDPEIVAGLAKGDAVRFRIAKEETSFRVVTIAKVGEAGAAGRSSGDGGADSAGLSGVAPEALPAPPFELPDQDGARRGLDSLRGKIVLLDFIYTHCPGPCPILTGTHVRVQRTLPDDVKPSVWFASVTLDPERDTPAALRQYAKSRGADLASWSFFGGTKPEIEDVLARYGVGSTPAANGEIQHVVVTFLIDREGRITKRYFGLDHHADDLVKDVAELARKG